MPKILRARAAQDEPEERQVRTRQHPTSSLPHIFSAQFTPEKHIAEALKTLDVLKEEQA